MQKKKWLVTGAAGFLGSHVVEQLVAEDQQVLGIDDLSWGNIKNIEILKKKNQSFLKIDIRDFENLQKALIDFQPQHIVHLAALHFIPDAIKNPTLAVDINLKGTQSLLQAARTVPFLTCFFASTGDVYEKTDEDNVESTTAPNPYNIYGASKHFGEKLVSLEHQQFLQKKFIVGRIYNLIGPRETNPHIIPEIIKQLKRNPKKLSLGNTWPIRDYVPVDECARAIIHLSLKANADMATYNIATGIGQSVDDLIRCMEKILSHKIEVEQDPGKIRSVERKRLVANVAKLRAHLGWTPSSQVYDILYRLMKEEGLVS